MLLPLAIATLALAGDGAEGRVRLAAAPVTAPTSFNPLPELWGLAELSGDTRLDELDGSFVLYLSKRAAFEIEGSDGRIYFAGGRQLVSGTDTPESCVCALEYRSSASERQLQVAAGAYRSARPPTVIEMGPRVARVEFELVQEGQAAHVRLSRLICTSSSGDTVAPLSAAVPGFMKLTRKEHVAFRDPPVDDRPVDQRELAENIQPQRLRVPANEYPGFEVYADELRISERFNAKKLEGTAKPGLLTLLREIRTGRKLVIDHSDYYLQDSQLLRLNRQMGIAYRDPCLWP